MATELDKLIVKIQADISDLQKGLAKANTAVKGASSKMQSGFDKANASLDKFSKTAFKVGAVVATAIGVTAVKGFVDVAIEIENLQVRLEALFGSASEGGKAFDEMAKFASKVPFSLGEIQRGAGSLAVVADDAEHLAKLLKITGNVASITGLSFQATAEQIQRSFAGGIASADMFREKGVRQMLGFEMGTKVSIEETADAFERVFGEGGKFGQASDRLAQTLTGTVSMIGDKFFNFQRAVGEGFFEKLKAQLHTFDNSLAKNEKVVQAYGNIVGRALGTAVDNIGTVLSALSTTLKAVFSFMIATFSINLMVGFHKALKAVLVTMRSLGATITAMSGGLVKLIGKIIVAIAVFTGLDAWLNKIANSAELEAKELEKLDKWAKIIGETYNLVNGRLKENAEVLSEAKKKAMELAEFNKKLDNIMAEIDSTFQDAGKTISDAFADAIVSGGNFKDAMKDIFQSVVKEILSTIVHIMVLEPLMKKLSDALRDVRDDMYGVQSFGFGNPISAGLNLAMAGRTSTAGMPTIPKANGGFVSPNVPYMVGEKGAEMFVPRSAGNIIPNSQMGGGVVVNQNISFSTGVVPTVRAEVMNLMPQIKKETVSAVAEARSRGGSFARTFGA